MGPCSWTNWGRYPRACRSSSSGCCRSAKSGVSGTTSTDPLTCAYLPRPIATWQAELPKVAFVRTSIIAFEWLKSASHRCANVAKILLTLARVLLAEAATRLKRSVTGVSPASADKLLSYGWPGNVRELANAVERVVVLSRGDRVEVEDLPEEIRKAVPVPCRHERQDSATRGDLGHLACLPHRGAR